MSEDKEPINRYIWHVTTTLGDCLKKGSTEVDDLYESFFYETGEKKELETIDKDNEVKSALKSIVLTSKELHELLGELIEDLNIKLDE